jgi:hypothetical protein
MFSCIPSNLIQPAATFFVGAVLAVIAFLQFKVAHDKLRLELFDRRYKIFAATKAFLVVITRNARFENSDLYEFFGGTSDAEFLFDADVLEYVKQISNRAIDMDSFQKTYQGLPTGDERSKWTKKERDELVWLTQQLTVMVKVFAPYLSYAKVKGDFLEDFINPKH